MKLITDIQHTQLIENARAVLDADAVGRKFDPKPIVKLITRGDCYRWLLSEMDPSGTDVAYALCDLGEGRPFMGYIHLNDLEMPDDDVPLRVEPDHRFVADKPISVYFDMAVSRGLIIT